MTTVLIADDHTMLREGLHMVLEAESGIEVVGEAEDGRQALEMVEQQQPDVVVTDIAMPNLNGLEATRQIKRRFPWVQVVILTMHEERQYLAGILNSGAIGAVLKRSAGQDLIRAVHAAARGQEYFSPGIETVVQDDYRLHPGQESDTSAPDLTSREREVLQLVAEGMTSRQIARTLGVSVKTVQTHRSHLMHKLDAHDRTDLVKYAVRQGMASI